MRLALPLALSLFLAFLPSASAVAAPPTLSCEPGTFNPVPPPQALCEHPEPVEVDVASIGAHAYARVRQCTFACGPEDAYVHAFAWTWNSRGTAAPDAWAGANLSRGNDPGTFGTVGATCLHWEAWVVTSLAWQNAGDRHCF